MVVAVLQSSVYGFANMFNSPRYTQAIMVGQGATGICVSVMRMVLKYTSSNTGDALYLESKLFFGAGCGYMILCVVGYLLLLLHPYVQFQVTQHESAAVVEQAKESLVNAADLTKAEAGFGSIETSGAEEKNTDVETANHSTHHETSISHVVSKIWREMATVFIVFMTTFAIFPTEIYLTTYKGEFGGEFTTSYRTMSFV